MPITFDKYIGIGEWCFVAQELTRLNLRREAMPFDWLFSNLVFVHEMIVDPQQAFMDSVGKYSRDEPMKLYSGQEYRQVLFPHHDVKTQKDYSYYERSWQRWIDILNSDKNILFIHAKRPTSTGVEELLKKIVLTIKDKYPRLRFQILSIDHKLVDSKYNYGPDYSKGIVFKKYSTNILLVNVNVKHYLNSKNWDGYKDRKRWNTMWRLLSKRFILEKTNNKRKGNIWK